MNQFKTVAELLADPKRWTQDTLARDKDGHSCNPESSFAVCWCVRGAVHKIFGREAAGPLPKPFRLLADSIEKLYGARHISLFNDSHSHFDVLRAVKKAGI